MNDDKISSRPTRGTPDAFGCALDVSSRLSRLAVGATCALALALGGCGGDRDDAAEGDAPSPPVVEQSAPADAANPAASDSSSSEDANHPDDPAFDVDFAQVLSLESRGQYGQALQAGITLRDRDTLSRSQRSALDQALQRIRETRREAPVLRHAIERLASEKEAEVTAARRQLRDAGDVGTRMLRAAVRDAEHAAAVNALQMLVEQGDSDAAAALLQRLENTADVDQRKAMLKLLAPAAGSMPLDVLPDILAFAGSTNGWPHDDTLRAMVDARLAADVSPADVKPLVESVSKDATFTRLGDAQVLVMLFRAKHGRDDAAFAKVAGDDAMPMLRAYAARAVESSDPAAVKWGRAASGALVKLNFDALGEGLIARWSFDQIEDAAAQDSTAAKRHLALVKPEEVHVVDGRAGSALRLWGRSDFAQSAADDDALRTIHHGSYTFALWIRARQLPPGRGPDDVSMLMGKIGDGWNIGLALTRRGNVQMTHYLVDHDSVGAVSREACAVGEWCHVAGVVDREKGLVRVFVNGQLGGEQAFTPGAKADTAQDASPIRLGRADVAISEYTWRYRGDLDEAVVYRRALSDAEIPALMASVDRE